MLSQIVTPKISTYVTLKEEQKQKLVLCYNQQVGVPDTVAATLSAASKLQKVALLLPCSVVFSSD